MPDSLRRRRPRQSRVAAGAEDFAEFLRLETTGGKLLLAASGLALLWANLAQDSYRDAWDTGTAIGPGWLQLDLTLGDWAADGLLAIFFLVAPTRRLAKTPSRSSARSDTRSASSSHGSRSPTSRRRNARRRPS